MANIVNILIHRGGFKNQTMGVNHFAEFEFEKF
jgi:hypothetical protein